MRIFENIDCMIGMEKYPDGFFDFAFSDPPYNKNKDYEIYKDNLSEEEYWLWVKNFISEYRRITNNKFSMFVGADLIKGFWDLMPDAKLIIIRKGAIGTPFKDYYRQYFGLLVTKIPNEIIYDLWWDIKMPGEGYFYREERFPNPGQTSLLLTQRVIRYFTKKEDKVFDGFMGCGTTAIACESLERDWAGTELNPNYISLAIKRIENYRKQEKLFKPEKKEYTQEKIAI